MQKLLHMSKKSSTFVPDLGIVPDQTIKTIRVMKKECVFRAQWMGKRYAIYVEPHPKKEDEVVFTTYCNRKRFDSWTWNSFEGAVGSILEDHPMFAIGDFRRVWG